MEAGSLLGSAVIKNSKEYELEETRKAEEEHLDAFPGLSYDDEPEEVEVEQMIIFLWEDALPFYDLYNILRDFLTKEYAIDTALMLRLIDEEKLDLKDSLRYIPYIHSGYISSILPKRNDSGS